MDWLDKYGHLTKGKHRWKYVGAVAKEDPSYLRWILAECDDCSLEDQEVIDAALRFSGGKSAL